jgi:hypothetical protein
LTSDGALHLLPSQLEVRAASDLEVTIALLRPGNLLPARTGIGGLARARRQTRQGPPGHQKALPPSGLLQVRLVGSGEPVLTQAREILRARGAGLTDEAAARRLGTSLHIYRRRAAELMAALEAGRARVSWLPFISARR